MWVFYEKVRSVSSYNVISCVGNGLSWRQCISLECVMGKVSSKTPLVIPKCRLFTVAFSSNNTVCSSPTDTLLISELYRILSPYLTLHLFQMAPYQKVRFGINRHLHLIYSKMLIAFLHLTTSSNTFYPVWKVVALSLKWIWRNPLPLMNLLQACRKESLLSLDACIQNRWIE